MITINGEYLSIEKLHRIADSKRLLGSNEGLVEVNGIYYSGVFNTIMVQSSDVDIDLSKASGKEHDICYSIVADILIIRGNEYVSITGKVICSNMLISSRYFETNIWYDNVISPCTNIYIPNLNSLQVYVLDIILNDSIGNADIKVYDIKSKRMITYGKCASGSVCIIRTPKCTGIERVSYNDSIDADNICEKYGLKLVDSSDVSEINKIELLASPGGGHVFLRSRMAKELIPRIGLKELVYDELRG